MRTHVVLSSLFLLVFAAAGCGGEMTTPPDDTGPGDASMDGGGTCAPGEIGCDCVSGACTEGECVSGTCTDCRVASEGCVCRSNGTCDTGLRCDDTTELCETCPPGEQDCACDTGDTCGAGLVCTGGVCVPDSCTSGTLDCPCRATDPRCDTGAVCDPSSICRACGTDMPGCPCASGACTGGLVCGTGDLCRTPVSCADLRLTGCVDHQVCNESTPGVDAVCVAMTCETGYRWRSSDSTCVACVSPDCSAEPTCDPGMPNSLDCAGENRTCETADGVGECTTCLTGYTEVGGLCVELGRCGSVVCGPTEYCDTTLASPACAPWPCPSLDQVRDTGGTCISCARSCAVPGSSGRLWPYADEGDECVCETLPGWYFDTGSEREPVQCDEDGDGWIRQEVRAILDRVPLDPAIVANARCSLRSAGAIELRDEYGNTSLVESCDEGLVQDRGGAGTCTPFPLRLFETKRNDVPGEAERLGEAPPYAAGGRRFRPQELNSLTKACVDALGDFDDDGFEDLTQTQPVPVATSSLGETARWRHFAHFVELYRTSWIEPPVGETLGHLVIQERSRCDTEFAITYGSTAAYDEDVDPTYWRNCERRRTPTYDADAPVPLPNQDFGQYTCSSRTGSCPVEAVPAHDTHATFPALPTVVRNHGLCETAPAVPAGGGFRGMHHHSQFQCVQVIANSMTPMAHQRRQQQFGGTSLTTTGTAASPTATLTMNACSVVDCMGDPTCEDTRAPTLTRDAYDPVLSCSVASTGPTPVEPAIGTIGWAAVRYQTYGERTSSGTPTGDTDYNGGCVNEQAEWPGLCPVSLYGICNAGSVDAFGRYCCFGCPDTGCVYPHAAGTCREEQCFLGVCDPGYGNCDRPMSPTRTTPGIDDVLTTTNGCENTLDMLNNCGGCGVTCARANVGEVCNTFTAGSTTYTDTCHINGSCDVGWGNCNAGTYPTGDADGCETSLDSVTNCTACATPCSLAHATVTSCAGRVCQETTCEAGWYDLNTSTGLAPAQGGTNDGCECQDDSFGVGVTTGTPNNACTGAVALGAVSYNSTGMTRTGRIPFSSVTAYDWYTVQFPAGGSPGRPDRGTVLIELISGQGTYALDVFPRTTGAACPDSAGVPQCTTTDRSCWSFQDNYEPAVTRSGYGDATSWPEQVYVRVHRRTGSTTCVDYQIRARWITTEPSPSCP